MTDITLIPVLLTSLLLLIGGIGPVIAKTPQDRGHLNDITVNQNRLLLKDIEFNNELPFLLLPGVYSNNSFCIEPKDWFSWAIVNHGTSSKGATIMRLYDVDTDAYAIPLLSVTDAPHPIILIPAKRTNMTVSLFSKCNEEPREIGLVSLKVPDDDNGWINADSVMQDFYSYEQTKNIISLTFPKNDTDDYRAISMTIAGVESGISPRRELKKWLSNDTRTWLFIQLPEGNDQDIFDSIPYQDFTSRKEPQSFFRTHHEFTDKNGLAFSSCLEAHVMLQNLRLNEEIPFLIFPSTYMYTLTSDEIYNHIAWLEEACKPSLPTEMYASYSESFQDVIYLSSQDAPHPIILIPAMETEMRVRGAEGTDNNNIPMELASLKVPDEKGGWINATERECEFYSYDRDNSWFKLTFPENKTREFRCIAMTIRTVRKYSVNGGLPAPISRTWLFIQLPWTDNPDVVNHIPYTDFTVEQLNL